MATSTPQERLPYTAPVFLCPRCQCRLMYISSESASGSDDPIALSDRYECPMGCGEYEFARETHRLWSVTERDDATRPR
jgi:hypothetical protein